MLVLFGLVFWLRSKHAYINESFTKFHDNNLFILISFISVISIAAISDIGLSMLDLPLLHSIAISLISPALMIAFYYQSKYRMRPPMNYEVVGNRIYPKRAHQHVSPVAIGAATVLMAFSMPFLQESTGFAIFLILLLPAVSTLLMFYARNTIADLQQIKSEERRLGIRYTFGNLEEIQAWRNRAWAPRLFRYFYTKLQSAFGQQ